MAELQMAATKKICAGELTENDLKNIINKESTADQIVCSIDVYGDGHVHKHTTTEAEVIDFACKCDDFDQLMKTIFTKRDEYQALVARAKNARDKKQQKES